MKIIEIEGHKIDLYKVEDIYITYYGRDGGMTVVRMKDKSEFEITLTDYPLLIDELNKIGRDFKVVNNRTQEPFWMY